MNKNVTSLGERIAYGGYFGGQNFILLIILNFLMLFYTDVVGIAAGVVTLIFLIARIWDAVNDPIMGIIIDKVSFKNGEKFKPWLTAGVFLLPLVTIFLFMHPASTMAGKITWAFITYILWGMIYTISDIPIFALATVMTDDQDERVRIISIGRLAAGIGALIGVIIITPLTTALGWTPGIVVVGVIAMAAMLPLKFKAVERISYRRDTTLSMKEMLKGLFKNRYLMLIYGIIIVANLTNTSSATIIYFVKYNLNNEMLMPMISLAGASSAILFPLFLPQLIRLLGKRKLFLLLMSISILSSILFYFVGYASLPLVFIFIALKYISLNLPILMMAMFTSDCLEYGYSKTKKRNEGMVFSVQTFSIKTTLMLQGVMGAFALSRANYVANQVQTPEALNEIWRMNTIYPVVGQVIAVVLFFFFYKLSESRVEKLIEGGSDGK